jgi:phosphoserine phosphatase RsbU/P
MAINRQLVQANVDLRAAQAQLIEKEKLERELHLAHEIQMSILPQDLPPLEGYQFGSLLTPARAVGGDFYDLIPLARDRLGIVIGDVTDKGVPAAIFMAQTHALLRAIASPRVRPGETLQRVNQQLLQMNASSLFVTVLYGILERDSGRFTYARAGHEIPLVCQSGEIQPTTFQIGQALGVLDKPIMDEQTLTLQPGSTLLLFTDGASDAVNPQQEVFGKDRLKSAFQQTTSLDGRTVCDDIYRAISAHQAGAEPFDDVTLVTLRRL